MMTNQSVVVHGGKTCGKATAVCIGIAHCVDETQPAVQVLLVPLRQTARFFASVTMFPAGRGPCFQSGGCRAVA